jgi:hopanoid biosynthesis associated RND transporter like protein HpnN
VRVVGFCIHRARSVIVAALLLTGVAGYYFVQNLAINADTSDMLSPDLAFQKDFTQFKKAMAAFGPSLVIVVEAASPDQAQDASEKLTERLRAADGIKGPVRYLAGDPFFAKNGLLFLKQAELSDLATRLADAQPLLATLSADPSLRGLFDMLTLALQEVEKGARAPANLVSVIEDLQSVAEARAAGDPVLLSWQKLLAGEDGKDGTAREFIRAGIELDYSSLGPAAKSMRLVRKVAEEAGLTPKAGIRIRITGGDAMATEELRSVKSGAENAGILSFVLVAGLLLICLGSFRLVGAVLLTLICGLVWTAGFAIAAVGHLNMISVAFAVLFIGLGVDFGLHFALRFREELAFGAEKQAALLATTKGLGSALTVCAVASVIGFFSYMPTAYDGLAELGLISGVGIVFALGASFTLLPALLAVIAFRPGGRKPWFEIVVPHAVIDRFGPVLLVVALVSGVAALALLPQVRFDFNPLHLNDPSNESVQTALDLIADPKVTPETMSVMAKDPAEAAAVAARLKKLPEVDSTVWLGDFVPADQIGKLEIIQSMAFTMIPVFDPAEKQPPPDAKALRAATQTFVGVLTRIAENANSDATLAAAARRLDGTLDAYLEQRPAAALRALGNAYLALFAGRIERLRQGFEATAFTEKDIPAALRSRYVAEDGRLRVEIFPKANVSDNAAMKRFVTAVRGVAPNATDTPVVLVESGKIVQTAIIQASLTALIGIFLLLWAVLRSLRDTFLVLLPLVLASAWTVAATVLLDLPFNYANVIVVPLLLGFGVDSGIHLVMRARGGLSEAELLSTCTPRAVVFSALTTIGSFGSLAVSNHRGTASMGELLMIAIGFTLIATLIVLPALMGWLNRRRLA